MTWVEDPDGSSGSGSGSDDIPILNDSLYYSSPIIQSGGESSSGEED